ncbi:hypothetical protein M427DRAFT_48509 [Gonapodya prolifera JEL478]|uniref:Uncharacterized protein n=1 Tax=Gonapodya prolifera (strain JEL478) TaxID=1344416 RepID=A0A139A0C6_GONPJ|nr:hypothetical protein M427DRAFT_48509 [Gonapodya prolifera JEL478]|eukprot:KXS10220.1 hypothetical protein M427DRAFT_48509 [Gonapodya prolifera JEL478]
MTSSDLTTVSSLKGKAIASPFPDTYPAPIPTISEYIEARLDTNERQIYEKIVVARENTPDDTDHAVTLENIYEDLGYSNKANAKTGLQRAHLVQGVDYIIGTTNCNFTIQANENLPRGRPSETILLTWKAATKFALQAPTKGGNAVRELFTKLFDLVQTYATLQANYALQFSSRRAKLEGAHNAIMCLYQNGKDVKGVYCGSIGVRKIETGEVEEVYKFGSTGDLHDRVLAHRSKFGEFYLMCFLETPLHIDVEKHFKALLLIRKCRTIVKDNTGGNQTEILALRCDLTMNGIAKLYKEINYELALLATSGVSAAVCDTPEVKTECERTKQKEFDIKIEQEKTKQEQEKTKQEEERTKQLQLQISLSEIRGSSGKAHQRAHKATDVALNGDESDWKCAENGEGNDDVKDDESDWNGAENDDWKDEESGDWNEDEGDDTIKLEVGGDAPENGQGPSGEKLIQSGPASATPIATTTAPPAQGPMLSALPQRVFGENEAWNLFWSECMQGAGTHVHFVTLTATFNVWAEDKGLPIRVMPWGIRHQLERLSVRIGRVKERTNQNPQYGVYRHYLTPYGERLLQRARP